MIAETMPATLLTLSDIATLTRVQRPVVSTWRSRSATGPLPFPAPIADHTTQQFFRADEVVVWLEATGRGKNPEARAEVALLSALTSLGTTGSAGGGIDELTALLTLKAITGVELRSLGALDLHDLADDGDPHDLCLYSELARSSRELTSLMAIVDDVASAGFTPAAAVEAVFGRRQRLGLHTHVRTELATTVGEQLARLVEAVASTTGATRLVAPCGGSDILVPLAQRFGEQQGLTLEVPRPRDVAARRELRRLTAAGWDLIPRPEEDVPDDVAPGHGDVTTTVVVLPSAHAPNPSTMEVIEAIDDAAMTLGPRDSAVVIGPASALVDPTGDRAAAGLRAKLLRTGSVRAILRLPDGVLVAQQRVALAVWVLSAPARAVAVEDRWVGVADLPRGTAVGTASEDLLGDVVACLADLATARSHAFRFLRRASVPELAASDRSLLHLGRPAPTVVRVDVSRARSDTEALLDHITTHVAPDPAGPLTRVAIVAPTVQVDPLAIAERGRSRAWTLGEIVRSGAVRMLPGTRLRPGLANHRTEEAVSVSPVIGRTEVLARCGSRRVVDRLAFASQHPGAHLTEPGDVVASLTGERGAVVDDGYSVVEFPARALRIDSSKAPWLHPQLLAAAIRTTPRGGSWESIPVPTIPAQTAPPLDTALEAVETARRDALAGIEQLDRLTSELVAGVASQAFDIVHPAHAPTKD